MAEYERVFVWQTSLGRVRNALPADGPLSELTEVDAAVLVESFTSIMHALDAMLASAPRSSGALEIDAVEVALTMAPDGKVAFLSNGSVPMRPESGLKVTLKRRPAL